MLNLKCTLLFGWTQGGEGVCQFVDIANCWMWLKLKYNLLYTILMDTGWEGVRQASTQCRTTVVQGLATRALSQNTTRRELGSHRKTDAES